MEPFSYFTDHQKIVLKKLWIPAIVSAILGVYVSHEIYQVVNYNPTKEAYVSLAAKNFYQIGLLFAIIFAYEQFIRKDWIRAIAIIAGYMATHFIFRTIQPFIKIPILDSEVQFFIWNCGQIIGICAIAGKKDCLKTGLFAGALIHACAFFPGSVDYLSFDGYNLLAAFHGFAVPYLIYTWLYIAENTIASHEYYDALKSKIQLISAAEYRLIIPVAAITTWVIILAASKLFRILPQYMHYEEGRFLIGSSILYILLCGFAFFTAARLIRNIALSRLMTIGDQGDWLLFLHFIPIANIIVWMVCANKENEHTTREENAGFYLSRDVSSLGATIITFSILINLYNTWQCYAYTRYSSDYTARIFMLLFMAKIVTYFLLRKGGKTTVILLVILNVITAAGSLPARFWGPEFMIGIIMFSLASYFYLIEVFAPALNKKELTVLPDSYAEAFI